MKNLARRARGARPPAAVCILGLGCLLPGVARAQAGEAPEAPAIERVAHDVSLAALLEYAERHAPNLAIAARRRAYGPAARAGAQPIFAQNPTLELGIGPRFQASGGGRDHDFFAVLEQPVEVAGQRGLRLAAAGRLGDRLDAEAVATRWNARQEISLGFWSARVGRERVALADRVRTFASDMLAIAQRRLAAGDVSSIDVRVAEVDLAQARQSKILAEQEFRGAQFLLCEITGWPLEAPPVPQGRLETRAPLPALEAVLQRAGVQHPELRARRAAVLEAQARAELEDREAWPTPTLGVSFAREGSFDAPESYVVLGTIGLPLSLWQRNQGERARARVDEDVARAESDATAQLLLARIARAHSDLRAAEERVALYASGVTSSLAETLALLRRGFEAGQIPIFNVAVARERILQAERDALSSYADYYRALAELEGAMGTELPGADDAR